jgi:hypothetical protein
MSQKIAIYLVEENKVAVLFPVLSCGLSLEQIIQKDIPAGVPYKIIDASELPQDRTFRDAWEYEPFSINFQKAKAIAHDIRRANRDLELAPHDEVISKQIPGRMESAEAARVLIREKYAQVQGVIDAATTVEQLKAALKA